MFKVPGVASYQQIATGFGQFLQQKYGVKATAVCFGDPNQNQAQFHVKQQVGQLKMSKWTLVQTEWGMGSEIGAAIVMRRRRIVV